MVSDEALLSEETKTQVLERLGFGEPPAINLDGLNALYQAWCFRIPFENVTKMIALREPGAPLPGMSAESFFDSWLKHGTGGTCWPAANAMFTLLISCGFSASRMSASMMDMGKPTHGSVKLRLDGQDWMADASILSNHVLPLSGADRYQHPHSALEIEVERVEDSYRIWFESAIRPEPLPCRLLEDPVGYAFFADAYEKSRVASPFNDSVYATQNTAERTFVLRGVVAFTKTLSGSEKSELSGDEIVRALVEEIHLSPAIVDRWVELGGLRDSLENAPGQPVT